MTSATTAELLPVVAAAASSTRHLVVSIHDIAPSNRQSIEKILADLEHRGVRVCSLLVVPDYHNEGLFTNDAKFVSWLRHLEAQGHEIVIHGYYHKRAPRPAESVRDTLTTRFYTRGEGEFYDLDYAEASRRIALAKDHFRGAGLNPHGFIAPAWLLNTAGEKAARDADLEYTTRLRTVLDLRSAENFAARSIVYSVDAPWRRLTSLAWNGLLGRMMASAPLLRVSIHPPDRLYPRIWQQIIDLLDRMKETRTATTYRDWIAEQRGSG